MFTKDVSRKLKVTRLVAKSNAALIKTNELISKLVTLTNDKDIDKVDEQFIDNLVKHLQTFVEYLNVMISNSSGVENDEVERAKHFIDEYGDIIESVVHFSNKPPSFDKILSVLGEHTTITITTSESNSTHRIIAFCFGEMPIIIDSRDMLKYGFTLTYFHLSHTTTINETTMKAVDDQWIEFLESTIGKISNVNQMNACVDVNSPADLDRYKKKLKIFYSLLPCSVS